MTENFATIRERFLAALDYDDLSSQLRFVEEQCLEQPELCDHLKEMLRAHHLSEGFLKTRADTTVLEGEADCANAVIGAYRIRELLGEGGMGIVYVAEQTEPVRRKVALKIIRPGMDSKEVLARFEAERQALAMMSHPNIAKVLDGGTTEAGRPYFVMELVRGIPITKYCDEHQLSTGERLELFITVCYAVQHAHQKGVIHRDLKPSNVLVELHDVTPVPKIIDFGIAKATSEQLTQRSIYTHFSQLMGTPMYMSPEQAQLSGLDVDTRSDVYSLGVLLYELLTGTTPFDKSQLSSVGLDEMRRIIREDEPPRPSHKVTTLSNEQAATISDRRRTDARTLTLSMRRELDWIVMKALEKDRSRRYESASAMAQDIQRYLSDEPVEACPPSVGYRLRKYARRHKAMLLTTCLILCTMIAATGVSVWYALDASAARRTAEAESDRARQAASQAEELLYSGDLQLAEYALRQNDVARVHELLERHRPRTGRPDLRGFEWFFLRKQIEMQSRVLFESDEPLYFVCYSPDDRLVAAAGKDATIRILNGTTFQVTASIESGQGEVNGLAFSPDSTLLASAGDDGTVCLWDVATGQCLRRIRAHDTLAYQVAFTPDGKLLASCGAEQTIRFWVVASGKPAGKLEPHHSDVECLAIGRNGLLASGSRDNTTVLLDLTVQNSPPHPVLGAYHPMAARWVRGITNWDRGAVTSVAFGDGGNIMAHGQKGGLLTLYDIAGEALVSRQTLPDGIQAIDISQATDTSTMSLAVGDRAGHIHLLPVDWSGDAKGVITSAGSFDQIRQWQAHTGRLYSLAFTPTADSLISAGEDGRLVLWNLQNPTTRRRLVSGAFEFAVMDNNRCVLQAPGLPIRRLSDGKLERQLTSADQEWVSIHGARRTRDVIAENTQGEVYAWRADGSPRGRIWQANNQQQIGSIAISGDGQRLALEVIGPGDAVTLEVIDTESGGVIASHPSRATQVMAISADGRYLAHNVLDEIHVVDAESGAIRHVLSGHRSALQELEFSPRSPILASVSNDRSMKVWDAENGVELWSVIAHPNATSLLAFSHDGETIATSGHDGMIRLWRWKPGRMVLEFHAQQRPVLNLEFTPDDRRLIANEFSCVTLYDATLTEDTTPTKDTIVTEDAAMD